ncbi:MULTISPECIES: flagellar basal body rod protein FlgB [Bacillus]|uniref:flagellar basal body rod protein FlgB n=1 Tax=Bacillus TaxID=1386 RepID=UPI0002D63FFB|nr:MULTISPECIES: flagellar basal body rod protein FlgB [Bacillus]
MSFFSGAISTLESALNYSSTKQKVISDNIANSDTPNYKAKDVNFKQVFEGELQSSISAYRTDQRHYEFNSQKNGTSVYVKNNVSYNHNGNSVDVDKEMSDLATNQIYYNAVTDRINSKFKSLENVIRGGK